MMERLTERQREIAGLVAVGFTNKAIAAKLGCGIDAVEKHVTAISERLELDDSLNLRVQITRLMLCAA